MSQPLERLKRLRQALVSLNADVLVLYDVTNIRWVTGFDGVFDDEWAHTLWISADRCVIHSDSRYAEALRQAARQTPFLIDDRRGGAAAFVADEVASLLAQDPSGKTFETANPLVVALEDSMSLGAFRSLQRALQERFGAAVQLKETHDLGKELRAVKDDEELTLLKNAQTITDLAFASLCDYMKAGMTERGVKRELEDSMVRLGADAVAFPSIIACGANGANPHAVVGDDRLRPGQCVVMDFGAVVGGYHADMTRTVFIGNPSSELRRAYAALRETNETIQAALRPGMTGQEAQALAEEKLDSLGFGGRMGHGLGHGVGLAIHELPTLSTSSKSRLEVGNVVTVEPGIYVPGVFGMRLEDFGVITETGFESFTATPHDLIVIEGTI